MIYSGSRDCYCRSSTKHRPVYRSANDSSRTLEKLQNTSTGLCIFFRLSSISYEVQSHVFFFVLPRNKDNVSTVKWIKYKQKWSPIISPYTRLLFLFIHLFTYLFIHSFIAFIYFATTSPAQKT